MTLFTAVFPTREQVAFRPRPEAYLFFVLEYLVTHAPERLSGGAAPELYLAALRELCDTCDPTVAARMWERYSESANLRTPLADECPDELHYHAFWRHGLAREIRERGKRRAHHPGEWQAAALKTRVPREY